MNKEIPLELDTVIDFGKYKNAGVTVQNLVDRDINYLEWMMNEADFLLSNEAFIYYQKIKETS